MSTNSNIKSRTRAREQFAGLGLLLFTGNAVAGTSVFHDALHHSTDPVLSAILVVTVVLIGGVIAFVAVPYMWERSNGTRSLWQSVCRLERENRRLREKVDQLLAANSPTPATVPQQESTLIRMLVVDSDEQSRNATAELLRSSGYSVELAADGESASRMIDSSEFDLILMDSSVAAADGNEFPVNDTPIVALIEDSASSVKQIPGISESLTKPVDIPRLLEILDRWLPQRTAQDRQIHL
jgi:CheY-like chemotaxis protein